MLTAAVVARGRVVVALAALLAGLCSTPGQAAVAQPTVLRARSSASLDVTFARPVGLDNDKVTVSGGRRFAGFYLHPLGAPFTNGTGNIYLHSYRDSRFDWLPLPLGGGDFVSFPPRTIPAGRYRLYALGDGPVEVRLPFTGYGARTLTATRPASVAFVSKNVTRDVLPGGAAGVATPGAVAVDLPIGVVSDKTISFTTSQLVTHGTGRTTTNSTPSCIGAADRPACATESKEANGAVHSEAQMIVTPAPPWRGIFLHNYGRYYFPGQLEGGAQTAHFVLAAVNNIDRATVAAVSIGL